MKTIYYFTAEWCGPCKKTRPIVEELNREQSEARFQIIDADDNISLVKQFNVRSVPTFILIKNGNEIKRNTGAQTMEQLKDLIYYDGDSNG